MYTEPKIVISEDMEKRAYITYYFNGVRYREYNGNKLNLKIAPNYCTTYKDRLKLIKRLAFEFTSALKKGWNPDQVEVDTPILKTSTLKEDLIAILQIKLRSDFSATYKRDLNGIILQLFAFLPVEVLNKPSSDLESRIIEGFLNKFNSSGTHYMNKRRALGVFFKELLRMKKVRNNLLDETPKMKQKAHLHKIYSNEQLKAILEFLKANYPNLHLACILAYECFLRPHQEARLLCVRHISQDLTTIRLSGNENKSKRIRVINVPSYVQLALRERITEDLNPNANILSGNLEPYNAFYLNTQWARAKIRLQSLNLIQENQTIYSFRHTAAVNVFRKTKSLHILQKMLHHSNMIVTLNYLRGLGEENIDELKSFLPEL